MRFPNQPRTKENKNLDFFGCSGFVFPSGRKGWSKRWFEIHTFYLRWLKLKSSLHSHLSLVLTNSVSQVMSSPSVVSQLTSDQAASIVDFLRTAGRLKRVPRAGWVRRGVPAVESVADHSLRVAMAAIATAATTNKNSATNKDQLVETVDLARCIGIAVVHDLAEAVVGDITPHDGISKEEKARRETGAIDDMRDGLAGGGCGDAGEAISQLWAEYEAGETPEARLVKDLDKVEMAIQALEYQEEHTQLDLSSFQQSAEKATKTQAGHALLEEVARRRRDLPPLSS